ncbi:hypothetical protein ACIQNI_19095 [Streptomyces sp. NPDC091266]|uniref:hypothetical protein n=1 Tax=Streptomyces sp. NPDC091266 TaxID=3365978 RepID=UPI003820B181
MSHPYNAQQPMQPPPIQPPAPHRPDTRPLHRRKRVWAGGVVLFTVATVLGGASAEDQKAAAVAPAPRPRSPSP